MGSYYYLMDKNSELGYTPVPEDEYIEAILRIAKEKIYYHLQRREK